MKTEGMRFKAKRWAVGLVRAGLGPWLDRWVYTVRGGIAQGLKRRGGRGFLKVPMTPEERFVSQLAFKGKTVYDIGAYQGVFTLFFARASGLAGQVVAFEPNPANYRRILENAALNRFEHIRAFNMALGKTEGTATLVYRDCERSMGSIEPAQQEELRGWGGVEHVEAAVAALDGLIAKEGLPPPDFVKIDVEGHEMAVLEGMACALAEHRPQLFIEVHGVERDGKRRNVAGIVSLLEAHGYGLLHVESGRSVSASDFEHALEGHLFCTPVGERA